MRDFQLRNDLQRVVIAGFALPLGIAPAPGRMKAPIQGYTVSYVPGEEDEPDTYSFHVVVSHEKLAPVLHRAFDLLPDEVSAIVEIGSRDAYRSTDTFIGEHPIPIEEFREVWDRYEPFLLEDGSIAAGANSEDPFIEVFVDQWKGLSIHVPLAMREDVAAMLQEFGLDEVQQTWPAGEEEPNATDADDDENASQVRPVLDLSDEFSPDIDELLLNLRHEWRLSLIVDPDSNIDEGGRNLGSTLWHAVVIVERIDGETDRPAHQSQQGAYASIWANASSLTEMERLIETALERFPDWSFVEIYTIDRVAYDERPDELSDLVPNRRGSQIHLVSLEPWGLPQPPPPPGDGQSANDTQKKTPR
jgi:hypothetical protein